MTEDSHAGSTDQPENSGDRGGPEAERHTNTQQSGVELRSVEATDTKVQIAAVKFSDSVQTGSHEDDDEQEERVGQQTVDTQHNKDDGIVAGEVGQVVVDATLDFAEVSGL